MRRVVDGLAKAAYLDDRIIIVTGFDPTFKLRDALDANARFERHYELEDNGGTCAGFAQKRSVAKRLQDQFGYPFGTELSFLGVKLGLQGKTPVVDCAGALCKMERRAQRIAVLKCALVRKQAVVRTMLLSMLLWTAPFQGLEQKENVESHKPRQKALCRKRIVFRNRFLLWAVSGPEFHPEFTTSWAVLASFLWRQAGGIWRPGQEHSRWPRFQQICDDVGWILSEGLHGGLAVRTSYGPVELGVDSLEVVRRGGS